MLLSVHLHSSWQTMIAVHKWTQLTNLSTTVPNLQTYALVLFGFHRTITDDMNWRSGLHIMNYWTGKHDQRPQNRLLCIVYVPTFTKPNKNMIQILVTNFSCFMNCYVKNVKFLNDKSLWCVQIVKKLFRIKTYFWIVGSFTCDF